MESIKVVEITEQEKEAVEYIFEYLNSVKILIRTLAEENEMYKENSDLFKDLLDVHTEYNKKYAQWWQEIRNKYGLAEENADKYFLNFEEHTIYQNC